MTRHALTVDVEDWYQVENLRTVVRREQWPELPGRLDRNMERILETLANRGAKATFFVLGTAAERHPQVVKSIVAAGHELASHGWSHELVYRQEPGAFREETRRAKGLLEDLAGERVVGYRASTFSITEKSLWALEILADEGFLYDSSIAPLRHDRYGIPTAPKEPYSVSVTGERRILEFPLSVGSFLGWQFPLGGGFFRLFSLRWAKRSIARYERRGKCAMLYLHPWELDPDQPRVRGLGWLRRFRHYTNLHKTRAKLEALLSAYRFTTVRDVLQDVFGEPIRT